MISTAASLAGKTATHVESKDLRVLRKRGCLVPVLGDMFAARESCAAPCLASGRDFMPAQLTNIFVIMWA